MKNTLYVLVIVLALATATALAQTSPSGTSAQTTTASPSSPSSQTTAPASQEMDRDKDKKHAKNKSVVDDTTLTQQIQQQLSSDMALKNVQVSVTNGVVNLEGSVPSKEEKKRAKQMVAGIAGVRKVHDRLKINASATATSGSNEPASASAGATGATGATSAATTSNTAGSIAGNAAASSTTPQTPTTSASIGSTTSASGMPQSEGASVGSQTTQIQNVIQQQIVNSNVQVNQTTNNIVLTGTVPTETDKQKAEEIARKQAGGLTVVNNIQVSSSASATMSNAPSSTLPQAETAPAGTSGATAAGAAGTSATTAGTAGSQTGTTGGAMSSASDLQTRCDTALKREPTLANDQINCVVSGDTIELSGSVMTGKERQTALRIAQSFAGNRRVEDRLTVRGRSQGANTGAPNPNQTGVTPSGTSNTGTGVNPSSTPTNPTSSPESTTNPR